VNSPEKLIADEDYPNFCFILDFYQLTNSTSDFKSRLNDVFDKLSNLEKQHDVQAKTLTPVLVPDDDTSSSTSQNPTIPSHAITFKKRPADDSFTRPSDKWKKYDLDDVNEHQASNMGNRHALNDFLRTRVPPSMPKEDELPSAPIFKRPLPKKPILTNEDEDEANQFIPIRAPIPANTTDNDNDDETTDYKLKSSRIKPRGVLSTNEKKPIKSSMEISEEKDEEEENDDDDVDDDDELFEP
jgi:hypothetical protein